MLLHSLKRIQPRLQTLGALGLRWQSTVALNYTVNTPESGSTKPPLVIVHGLFGSKQNWRAISKQLCRTLDRPTYTVDQRNHGDSPHLGPHTYTAMSNDLVRFINDHQLGPVVLLGHSMGGKTVMQTTLERPDLVSQLIVDDIAPMRLDMAHDFAAYVEKLKYIERMDIKSQSQADAMLQEVEPDISVRQFLLTNMKKDRETGAYRSRIPLQLLGDSLQSVMDWDVEGKSYEGPTLFIGGERSLHIREKAFPCMKKCFPNYELEMLDTGHWVHAEMPREFMQLVEEFVIRHS